MDGRRGWSKDQEKGALMAIFELEKDGEIFEVDAPSEQLAVAAFKRTSMPKAPSQPMTGIPELDVVDQERAAEGKAGEEFLSKAVDVATPLGSLKYIGKGLAGTGPMTPMGAGLAAMDIASLGLAGKVKAGAKGAELGVKGVKQALAGGAGAGLAGLAAQEMGAPVPVQLGAGLAGGVLGGRVGGVKPQEVTKLVPKRQEAQALSRVIQGMGIPMETPKSSRPGDVAEAFSGIRSKLGADVGAAKEALYQTEAATPLIRRRVAGAGYEALKKAGVPILESGMAPELSKNPEASKAVMETLDKLNSIPKDMPPAQAMEISNNLIEALQAKLAQSAKPGSPVNLKGPIMGESIGAMEKALKDLAPGDAAKVMDSADSAFSKLATLHDMAFKSSKTMAQEGPRFNPRKFLFMWETMKPNEKAAKFTADEIAAIDFLVEQKDPNIFMQAARKGIEVAAGAVNKLGILDLKHHPATRFKEKGLPFIGREEVVNQLPFFSRSAREEKKKKGK